MIMIEKIGTPAMLELMAEECAELAQASLKLARHLRNENPTFKTSEEVKEHLYEETADVLLCIDELLDAKVIDSDRTEHWAQLKQKRAEERYR